MGNLRDDETWEGWRPWKNQVNSEEELRTETENWKRNETAWPMSGMSSSKLCMCCFVCRIIELVKVLIFKYVIVTAKQLNLKFCKFFVLI